MSHSETQRKAVAKATQAPDTGAGEIETGLGLAEAGKAGDKREESRFLVTCPAHAEPEHPVQRALHHDPDCRGGKRQGTDK